METLHGIAAHPGVAIASAARLHDDFGVPSLAPSGCGVWANAYDPLGMNSRSRSKLSLSPTAFRPASGCPPSPALKW